MNADQLGRYVYGLWLRAGCPSSRTVAAHTGVNATTANDATRWATVRTWQTAELVVAYLDGDMAIARSLWEARVAEDGNRSPEPPGPVASPLLLTWKPSNGFQPGRAFDTAHEGEAWRIVLALQAVPLGAPWIDDQPCDGWQLHKARGGRMQPIAAATRPLTIVMEHAETRILARQHRRGEA